ncbi:DUF7125 family protein [Natronobacterium texcoconense]|uniref:MinD-like ATPase involved in chromosome partitioning or flagellar assembly n=1 Tax=Natronobacterium texcoconense TaxID=1095778 RepID=A0A1H0YU49_NATTX|nr:AAA family ATPase [Natronobacterium texcoconense]SDQ18618.1 MinD-like ATPase involved in chromosome partitioning or flagellar assembly [Natronobacterium texcoconense]
MLAIAGAKGGCGKTTITLGLADAFARNGTPTVAVDADRQLPNLHVLADVDREPTIAELENATDIDEITHSRTETDDVGVLPAATTTQQIDLEAAIGRLRRSPKRVLVDCPSGAGPDAIEALEYADRVVVVATNTDRGLRGAGTTIDVAHRLDVPIAGIVINQSSGVTDVLESKLEAPVLGTIPEHESPLTGPATREAFDDIAARLTVGGSESYRRRCEYNDNRLPVGNQAIDRALQGGVPPGTTIALTADPASQSEQFLYQATATRGTLYLTTDRTGTAVEAAIGSATVRTGNPTVRHLENDPLEHATRLVDELPDGANLVVDSMNALERTNRDDYLEFLNGIVDRMHETRGIAVLHCLKPTSSENRTVTRHLVDAVFDLRTITAGENMGVTHRLSVPKFRFDGRVAETIEFDHDLCSNDKTETGADWPEVEAGDLS